MTATTVTLETLMKRLLREQREKQAREVKSAQLCSESEPEWHPLSWPARAVAAWAHRVEHHHGEVRVSLQPPRVWVRHAGRRRWLRMSVSSAFAHRAWVAVRDAEFRRAARYGCRPYMQLPQECLG